MLPGARYALMRLNSCFSWNSATLPESLVFENASTSTSLLSSFRRPSMRVRLITNSPTAFIIRSSCSSERRTDLVFCGTVADADFPPTISLSEAAEADAAADAGAGGVEDAPGAA